MPTDQNPPSMDQLASHNASDAAAGWPLGRGPTTPTADAAMQRRLKQLRTVMGEPQPAARFPQRADAGAAQAAAAQQGRSASVWQLPALALLGLGLLATGWALRPQPAPSTNPLFEQVAAAAVAPTVVAPAPSPSPAPLASNMTRPGASASAVEPPVAGPQPVLMPADEQIKRTVEAWRADWAARDMAAYFEHYSETFAPADGVSRRDWIASRYRNVGGRPAIEVQIQALKIEALATDRARVRFLQDYAAGSYRESAQPKTLDLVLEADDRWRIRGEWQGEPPPAPETGKP